MAKSKQNTKLELRLDKILKELKLTEPISVDDLKSLIWSETDHMDLARLFQLLTEDEAYHYWQEQGKFWEETEGAIVFLQKYYSNLNNQN